MSEDSSCLVSAQDHRAALVPNKARSPSLENGVILLAVINNDALANTQH
jgi:hypothetical protein